MPMNNPMARIPPAGAPPPDLFDLRPVEPEEPVPPAAPSSLSWARLAIVYLAALGAALLFRFPPSAVLALPLAALSAQAVRRLRWPYRFACAAVFAAYAAQISSIVNSPAGWGLRFASAFVLILAAAFFWGLQVDEL
jgi:hypothetical protein